MPIFKPFVSETMFTVDYLSMLRGEQRKFNNECQQLLSILSTSPTELLFLVVRATDL